MTTTGEGDVVSEIRHTGRFEWRTAYASRTVEYLARQGIELVDMHRRTITPEFASTMLAALGDGRRYVVRLEQRAERFSEVFTIPHEPNLAIVTTAEVLLVDPDDAQVGESVVHGPKFQLACAGRDDASVVEVRFQTPGDRWETPGAYAIFGRSGPDVWTRHA